jgi:hypothetical protein
MKNTLKALTVAVCVLLLNTAYSQVSHNIYKKVKPNYYASSVEMDKTNHSFYALRDEDGDDTDEGTGLYLGIRFMPTFTVLDYAEVDGSTVETTMVLGYGFGGVLGVNLSEHIGLQGEVIYSSLSQKYKIADQVNTVKLRYINVPLLLAINTGTDKPVNFNVVVGPQLGFNVGSNVDSEADGTGTDTVHAVVAVKKGDLGFAYGAGLDFGGDAMRLSIGFRGVYGLIDISDNSNNITTNEYYVLDRAHVKTYAGYIGLTFGF